MKGSEEEIRCTAGSSGKIRSIGQRNVARFSIADNEDSVAGNGNFSAEVVIASAIQCRIYKRSSSTVSRVKFGNESINTGVVGVVGCRVKRTSSGWKTVEWIAVLIIISVGATENVDIAVVIHSDAVAPVFVFPSKIGGIHQVIHSVVLRIDNCQKSIGIEVHVGPGMEVRRPIKCRAGSMDHPAGNTGDVEFTVANSHIGSNALHQRRGGAKECAVLDAAPRGVKLH